MNYFAHAWVAGRIRPERRFVLGAMLPDLAGFLRIRLPEQSDTAVAAGLALHQATDAAFHALPAFRERNRAGVRALGRLGLGRGPARAAAHVGIELALDALLARRCGATLTHYRTALRALPSLKVQLGDARQTQTLHQMARRLAASRVGPATQEAAHLCERVRRTLAPRPSLALEPRDIGPLTRWLDDTLDDLEASGEAMSAATLQALGSGHSDLST